MTEAYYLYSLNFNSELTIVIKNVSNLKFEIFSALSFRKFETNPTLTDIRNFSIYMDSKQRQLWRSKFFRLSI